MKRILTILSNLIGLSTTAQTGFTYVKVGYKDLIDKKYEKIIDREYVDFHDGSMPGMYYKVYYNYGDHPLRYDEIVKCYLNNLNLKRRWKIKFKLLSSINSDDISEAKYLAIQTNPKATFYFKKYIDTLTITYCDTFSIEIKPKGYSNSRISPIKIIQ